MKCKDYHNLWHRRLDGDIITDHPEAAEHLRSCPSCTALQRATLRLAPALRELSSPSVPPGLTARIVQAALQDRRQRLHRQRWRRLASLAAAACLLLVLGMVLGRPSPTRKPSAVVAQVSVKPSATKPGTVHESVQEMGEVVASLTSRTADATVGRTRLLLPALSPSGLGELAVTASLEPPAQSLKEAGANISAGLAPVRQSARRAVELFLRELPVDNDRQSGL